MKIKYRIIFLVLLIIIVAQQFVLNKKQNPLLIEQNFKYQEELNPLQIIALASYYNDKAYFSLLNGEFEISDLYLSKSIELADFCINSNLYERNSIIVFKTYTDSLLNSNKTLLNIRNKYR